MKNTLKNLRNAALGLSMLVGGAAIAKAEVPAQLRETLVQEVDFDFARTGEYKYGGDLTLAENPRTTLPGCTFGCNGQDYTVILFNEEIRADNEHWLADGGVGNVSSKGLVAKMNIREDYRTPEIEMVRDDGQCQSQRCMYGVNDLSNFLQNIEQMEINFRRNQVGVNNLETGTAADQRVFLSQEAETLGIQAQDLGDTLRLTPQQTRIWNDYKHAMGFSADPKGFSYLRVLAAQGDMLTLERKIYKGQPDDEGFNGRKDYLATEIIVTNATLDANGNIAHQTAVGGNQSVVHYFSDIHAANAANWQGYAFLRKIGANGLTDTVGKIDVRGEFSGGHPNQKVAVAFNMEDFPSFCGQHERFNYPGDACIDGKFDACLLDDTIRATVDYDATQFNRGAGRARVRQTIGAPGISSFVADFFDAAVEEIMGKTLIESAQHRVWLYGNGTTNVGVVMTVEYIPTGQTKVYTNVSGTDFKAILDQNAIQLP